MSKDYEIFREQLAIRYPSHGHAIWGPSPPTGRSYNAVQVGDVGFMLRGSFHRLFNVLLPEEDESHRGCVPPHHKPLEIRMSPPTHQDTLPPNYLRSKGVSVGPETLQSRPDQQSFSCSTERGAVLCLPVSAQREDTVAPEEFAKYILKHIEEWFAFARELGTGIRRREDIILVTGRDLVRSWANIAFQDKDERVAFEVKVIGDSQVEWRFTPEDAGGVAYKHGPNGNVRDLPENQCIFIRGFRATRIAMILPRLRAAAGPARMRGEDHLGSDTRLILPRLRVVAEPALMEFRDSLDSDMELISFSSDTDPFYTLLKYIAIQAPDCDMALIHDHDLLCVDGAPINSLQPDPLMTYLRQSAPKIWRSECGYPRTVNSEGDASTGEAPPSTAAVKIATLSEYTFDDPIAVNVFETNELL